MPASPPGVEKRRPVGVPLGGLAGEDPADKRPHRQDSELQPVKYDQGRPRRTEGEETHERNAIGNDNGCQIGIRGELPYRSAIVHSSVHYDRGYRPMSIKTTDTAALGARATGHRVLVTIR